MRRDDEFSAYVAAQSRRLVRSAVLLGCTIHEAEDLVQETLERCYVKWSRVCRAANVDAYVHRMLVNCYNDSRRRRWWGERPTEILPEVVGASSESEMEARDAVERALGCLTPTLRVVVVLRFYAQLTELETAQALDVPIGTVKSRSSRALAELARSPHVTGLAEGGSS